MHKTPTLGFVLRALLLCAVASIPFSIENAVELAEYLPANIRAPLEAAAEKADSLSTKMIGTPKPRHTAVVALSEDAFPEAFADACKQREIVADLIGRVTDEGAALLVIDFAFRPGYCPSNSQSTRSLIHNLTAYSRRIPIVIGQSSVDLNHVSEKARQDLLKQGMANQGLLLLPLIELPPGSVSVGLIRSDEDLQRVPLEWPTYLQSGGGVRYAGMRPTIALVAARTWLSDYPSGTSTIDEIVGGVLHPRSNLIREEDFIRVNASSLTCKYAVLPCGGMIGQKKPSKLLGKIAIIGWADDQRDLYQTPVGQLSGIFMQANYIEALFEPHRIYRIPRWPWRIGLSLVWFGLIEFCFERWQPSVIKPLLASALVYAGIAVVVHYFVVVNVGWYLALIPPSVTVLVLRAWYQLARRSGGHSSHVPVGQAQVGR